MTDVTIRPIAAADRAAWDPLWAGYNTFYDRPVPKEATEITWQSLVKGGDIHGFLAVDASGQALGLVHYLFHATTSTVGGNCYLPDLFVSQAARGKRVGRRLIAAVEEAARQRGAAMLYWQTEEFNGPARRLYERVAKRSPFIRYQIAL